LQLYLEIRGEQVRCASFRTFGCAASIAAGSMLTELVAGASLSQVRLITSEAVNTALGGLPPLKVHGSALAADALRAALEDYRRRCETENPDPITQPPS
jgi:nitrogen fixation NifU-like protein